MAKPKAKDIESAMKDGASASVKKRRTAFAEHGMEAVVDFIIDEIQQLYREDNIPWVIGYSGGKDSTAIAQLVWMALNRMPKSELKKPVHIISTDTLVENPVVAAWVNGSLVAMRQAADKQKMPVIPHRLTPEVGDTFWVTLIGKGYPAPRNMFRWCTDRLKIKPSNTFIKNVVSEAGEAILVLGMRKAESVARARSLARHAEHSVRERLTPSASLANSLIYTPIEDWSDDDVWQFLLQVPNAWGYNNQDLMAMYRAGSEDGECPLVVDTSTPSCGNSRFGCFVCTLVDKDKSMEAMLRNDADKDWMLPMLDLRNSLEFRTEELRKDERARRSFRRINGSLTAHVHNVTPRFNTKIPHNVDGLSKNIGTEKEPNLVCTIDSRAKRIPACDLMQNKVKVAELYLVHGPYTQEARAELLKKLLETQKIVREIGPKEATEIELISLDELQEIRRIWVNEKHEIEDLVPLIWKEVMESDYPGDPVDEDLLYDKETLDLLKEECGKEHGELVYELARNLLDVERQFRTHVNRRGLFSKLEATVKTCFYDDELDALDYKIKMDSIRKAGDEAEHLEGSDAASHLPDAPISEECEA
ncbi:MAG: hypothetical protein RL095_2136 [Verrucomicrobiota bacterium]|jgi:DNA sulfur modification protein DndC